MTTKQMIADLVRKARGKPPRPFEYVPEGWSRAMRDGRIKGWNRESVFAAQFARWQRIAPSAR